MEEYDQIIDKEKQRRAKEYQKKKIIFKIIGTTLFLAYFLILIFSNFSFTIKEKILYFTNIEWQVIALYVFFILTLYDLLSLPLEFYTSYTFEHKYHFCTQTLGDWFRDWSKSYILSLALAIPIIEGIYWAIRTFPQNWYLVVSVFTILLAVLLSHLSPILLTPLFFKLKKIEGDNELAQRLIKLCNRVNTKVKGVYEINFSSKTTKANAYLSGLGNTRRIVIADNLLKNFTLNEVEVVFAHELSHHVHKDVLKGILWTSLIYLGAFYFTNLILRKVGLYLSYEVSDISNFPVLALSIGIILFLFSIPLNFNSRKREHQADEFALKITQKADAFITSMAKFTNRDLADAHPHPFIEFLLCTHPSIGKRINYAQEFKKKIELEKQKE
jgi:STE24 endopeptidase